MTSLFMRYKASLQNFALQRFSITGWWLLAALAYAIARLLQFWLDGSYAASRFPVPFFVGQTTFDAIELKGYFAVLVQQGTLGIFARTQIIDYAFMAGTFVSFYCLASALMRTVKRVFSGRVMRSIALVFVWLSPLAAVMDALENAVSFVMLANPLGFYDWLVYPYSSFAVIKFALFALTYCWAIVALASCLLAGFASLFFRSTEQGVAK